MPSARPLVVAHRGASAARAEHTLAAYSQAVDEGADGLECDVRLTSDGHLVCVHDRRLERTSDGRGAVSQRSLDELNGLDFGSWKDDLPESADALVVDREVYFDDVVRDSHRRVLTFERLLELVVDHGQPLALYVETKHPTRYGGLVEQKLVSSLRRFGLVGPFEAGHTRAVMMSFSPIAVRRVREMAPDVDTVVLFEAVPRAYRDGSLPHGAKLAGPGLHILREHPRYVSRVHAVGNQVYVWTVDEPDDIDYVLSLGADVIATNRPADVLARIEAYQPH